MKLASDKNLLGDRVHLPGHFQKGHPVRGFAPRLAQHPARAREFRGARGVGKGLGRLQQGRASAGANLPPTGPRLDHVTLVVTHQREAAGHRQPVRQRPSLRAEAARLPVQEEELGGSGAQQTRIQARRIGRIETLEAQRRVVRMEGLVVFPHPLPAVADEPVLGLGVPAGELVDALPENRPIRLAITGDLHDMACPGLAPLRTLERGNQRRGLDLAPRQRIGQRRAVGDELRLPGDHVLAVRHVAPARVGREVRVLVDVRDEVSGHAVVEADAAAGTLAETNRVLASLVHVEPVLGGFRHVAGDSRCARRPNERHALGSPRHREEIGPFQEIEQEYLQPAVEQRGTRDVALAPAGRPQRFIHLDVDEIGAGRGVDQHSLDGPEVGTVLERLAEDGVEAFVEVAVVGNDRGCEPAPVEILQAHRHFQRRAGARPRDPAPAMQLALRVDVVGPRRDGEGERVRRVGDRMQGGLQPHRNLRDGAGLEELEHLDVNGFASEGLQDQLDVAGGRHDRRVVDAVVRHPGEVPVREPRLEEHVRAGHLVTDQRPVRVLALPDEHLVVAHDVHRRPVLSRMSGQQMDDGLRARVLGGEVEGHAGPEQRPQGLLDAKAGVGVPHEGRNAGRRRAGALQALRDGGLEGAVRRDLQHHARLKVAPDGLHRRREPHRPADVRPPVVGVQPLRPLAGHRGHERDAGVEVAIVQERQGRQRIVPERVHGGGVKGDIARQQAILPVAPIQLFHDGPQRRLPAADDGAGRGILAGDLDARRRVFSLTEGNLQGLEQLFHPRTVETDGEHASGTGNALLQRGAMEHQARRVRQRQRAARVGGGHLAGAVPDHAVRMDAPRSEPFHQGALQHEDDGLGEPDLVERFL